MTARSAFFRSWTWHPCALPPGGLDRRPRGGPADRGGACREHGFFLRHRPRRRAGPAGPADPGLRRVLRARRRRRRWRSPWRAAARPGGDTSRWAPSSPPAAGPEGGPVLRRRTRPRRSPGARRAAAARPQPVPAAGARAACRRCSTYLDALTGLGQAVLRGVALSLGLDADYFAGGYTADPTVLFRIFRYPPSPPQTARTGASASTPTTAC